MRKIRRFLIGMAAVTIAAVLTLGDNGTTNAQTLQSSKLFVTPEDFGAKGNDVYDDSSAFTKMFNSAYSKGYDVKIPAKTYLLSTKNIESKGVNIIGSGKKKSVIIGVINVGSNQTIKGCKIIGKLNFNKTVHEKVTIMSCILDGDEKYEQIGIVDRMVNGLTVVNTEFTNGTYALNLCNKGEDWGAISNITVSGCYFHDNSAMNFQCISRGEKPAKVGFRNILIEDSIFIGVPNATKDSQINVSFDGYMANAAVSDNKQNLPLSRDVIIQNCIIQDGYYLLENAGVGNVTVDNCLLERTDSTEYRMISMSGYGASKDYKANNMVIINNTIKATNDANGTLDKKYSYLGGGGLIVYNNHFINTGIVLQGHSKVLIQNNYFDNYGSNWKNSPIRIESNYLTNAILDNNLIETSVKDHVIMNYSSTKDSVFTISNNKVRSDYHDNWTEYAAFSFVPWYNNTFFGKLNIENNNINQFGELLSGNAALIYTRNNYTFNTTKLYITVAKKTPDGELAPARFTFNVTTTLSDNTKRTDQFVVYTGGFASDETNQILVSGTAASKATATINGSNNMITVVFSDSSVTPAPNIAPVVNVQVTSVMNGAYTVSNVQ